MEKKCPGCYFNLPDPETVLAPYDTELSYFMWGPGFEWQPDPVEESMTSLEESYEESEQHTDDEYGDLSGRISKEDAKSLFDANARNGRISVEDASNNARKLGLAPSSTDEEKAIEKFGDSLSYDDYLVYLSMCVHENDNAQDLAGVFATFDINGTGYLTKKQMRNILTTWGDALTVGEADEILDAFSKDDKVDYKAFCEYILQ